MVLIVGLSFMVFKLSSKRKQQRRDSNKNMEMAQNEVNSMDVQAVASPVSLDADDGDTQVLNMLAAPSHARIINTSNRLAGPSSDPTGNINNIVAVPESPFDHGESDLEIEEDNDNYKGNVSDMHSQRFRFAFENGDTNGSGSFSVYKAEGVGDFNNNDNNNQGSYLNHEGYGDLNEMTGARGGNLNKPGIKLIQSSLDEAVSVENVVMDDIVDHINTAQGQGKNDVNFARNAQAGAPRPPPPRRIGVNNSSKSNNKRVGGLPRPIEVNHGDVGDRELQSFGQMLKNDTFVQNNIMMHDIVQHMETQGAQSMMQ